MLTAPPRPVLRAAARWCRELKTTPFVRVEEMFRVHPSFKDLTPTQYMAGLDWLLAEGFALVDGETIHLAAPEGLPTQPVALLAGVLQSSAPDWLNDIEDLADPRDLPLDFAAIAEDMSVDLTVAWEVARAVASKVDADLRARVGAEGEEALVELLRRCVDAEVQQVSLLSDALGFDVSVEASDWEQHLEVKTTTRRGRLVLFISRNEFDRGRRDPDWQLVVVLLQRPNTVTALFTIDMDWLLAVVPDDRVLQGRWESARLAPPPGALAAGIPRLSARLRADSQSSTSASLIRGHGSLDLPEWVTRTPRGGEPGERGG